MKQTSQDGAQPGADAVTHASPPVASPSDWMFLQPAILDQMHDAIIIMDLDGIVTGCNRAAQETYGYAAEELIGKSAAILHPADDQHLFQEQVVATVRSAGEYRNEVRVHTRSGDTIYVHVSITLLRDGDGNPAGMVGFSINITSRKLGDFALSHVDSVEKELRTERSDNAGMRLLAKAVESATDVVLITEAEPVDQPGPRIVYVNAAFEQMTGYSRAEVIGQTPRILQGPNTDRAALDRIRAALKRWLPVREEMTNYRKDGTEFTVELSVVPLADEAGWYTHWIAIQRDMTEQKRIRERLAHGESRLDFLTETMPQLLWTASGEGNCEFVSRSCAQFLGLTPEQCYGHGWYRAIHPDDLERATAAWLSAVEQQTTFITEYRLRRYDGTYIWYLHRAVPRVTGHGKVSEWIGSSTDIEVQKKSEEAIRQTEKIAAVGRLASSIAHEINNPLSSVTNLLYLISSHSGLDKTVMQYVMTAQEELARVSEITTQTLRFHQQSVSAAPVRLNEILDAVLTYYRPRIKACGIKVTREYQQTEQLICLAADIRQAVGHIVGNAIEASTMGGKLRVRLRPSVTWKLRQRRGLRITIGDSGHGIAKGLLTRIFEPFYTTKGITGTGLGLWITKDLIAKQEGSILVRSSTNARHPGTVVSIFLPFELHKR